MNSGNKTLFLTLALASCVTAFLGTANCQTFSVLYNFGTNPGDPLTPFHDAITQGRDGNLYSASTYGGLNNDGTVFEISEAGLLTTLHSFNQKDGFQPSGGLVLGTDGNFYGTTNAGGGPGFGTVFKVSPGGVLTVLHEFVCATDGCLPYGSPVPGNKGSYFGTTESGGSLSHGTVYRITSSGDFGVMYEFDDTHGANPKQVIRGRDGNFYGITTNGGAFNRGVIYRISASGSLTILHDFDGKHGGLPTCALMQANDGNFYGTTQYSRKDNAGVIFRITPTGTYTVLHYMNYLTDGANPDAGLVQATDGSLYGVAPNGGIGYGTIFRLHRGNEFSVVYTFDGTGGQWPNMSLVQHTDGKLYGQTPNGGAFGFGTFFTLDVGLEPFVRLWPFLGSTGATVGILSQGLTGATSVNFNGTPAVFVVKSDTFLQATVPAGASSGFVTVDTPTGTLKSNTKFWVR